MLLGCSRRGPSNDLMQDRGLWAGVVELVGRELPATQPTAKWKNPLQSQQYGKLVLHTLNIPLKFERRGCLDSLSHAVVEPPVSIV